MSEMGYRKHFFLMCRERSWPFRHKTKIWFFIVPFHFLGSWVNCFFVAHFSPSALPFSIKKNIFPFHSVLRARFVGWIGPRKAKQSTGLFLCRSFFAFGSNSLPCYPNLTPFFHKKRTSYDVLFWWKGVDSDHRSDNATDLQSAPFGRSGTLPYIY